MLYWPGSTLLVCFCLCAIVFSVLCCRQFLHKGVSSAEVLVFILYVLLVLFKSIACVFGDVQVDLIGLACCALFSVILWKPAMLTVL